MGARAEADRGDGRRYNGVVILVDRGKPDEGTAVGLSALETRALTEMRRIVQTEGRDPNGAEIAGFDYKIVGDLLCRRQGRKCAYCEHPEQRRKNDVEHFRPKGRADRGLFHSQSHGYWWLAWRWENLLFACRNCNQDQGKGRGKVDRFPLDASSGVLVAEDDPYGGQADVELPMLLDPSRESGVDHIEYRKVDLVGEPHQWRPLARGGSPRGDMAIWLLGLDREDLLEAYNEHVDREVIPLVDAFESPHPYTSTSDRVRHWRDIETKLYRKGTPFIGLSYDALRFLVPDADLALLGIQRRVPR